MGHPFHEALRRVGERAASVREQSCAETAGRARAKAGAGRGRCARAHRPRTLAPRRWYCRRARREHRASGTAARRCFAPWPPRAISACAPHRKLRAALHTGAVEWRTRAAFAFSCAQWSLQRFAVSVLQACSPLVTLVLFVSHADMPRLGYLRRARVCLPAQRASARLAELSAHRIASPRRAWVGGRRWHGVGGRLEALGACSGGSDWLRCLPTSLARE